jgi:hypothetical protein
MAIFYTDTGSFNKLDISGSLAISGSGSAILSISGSTGGLLEVSDLTAGANIFQITSASIDIFKIDQSKNVRISGSLIVTGSIIGNANINVSAGTTSNNISQLIFSNANSHTFGLNSNTITVSYQVPIQSYFEHIQAIQNSSTSAFGNTVNLIQPFILPYDISIGYIRVPINFSFQSSTFATTANTSIVYNQSNTFYANIYTAGTGASSKSLQQLAQGSVSLLYQASATEGANSNAQTVAHVFSYFTEGITTATAATTFTIANSSNFNFTTNVLSLVSGIRMIDIPFATSIPAGEYWIAFQRSSNTATTGLAAMTNLSLNNQYGFITQPSISGFGFATNNSTGFQMQPGVGSWSATNQGGTSNSIALSQINSVISNPRTPFQLIRFA